MTCPTIGRSASGLALALITFLCGIPLKAFGRGGGAIFVALVFAEWMYHHRSLLSWFRLRIEAREDSDVSVLRSRGSPRRSVIYLPAMCAHV